MDYTTRKTHFDVKIRKEDRRELRAKWPDFSLQELDKLCILKAAQRDAMGLLKSTSDVLDCCVEGIPNATISGWAKNRAKLAA